MLRTNLCGKLKVTDFVFSRKSIGFGPHGQVEMVCHVGNESVASHLVSL